jgi:hypothetical protein
VLSAADFARAEDLSDVFKFGVFAERIQGLETGAYAGNITQLQGYVTERLVALHLQSAGYEVEFPETPNQPGYDLLVNGQPHQVKCLADSQGVYEHLERYPDIPVLVNGELAGELEGIDGVVPVSEITHAGVMAATESSVQTGAEILDFEVSLIAAAIASGRNLGALIKGKTGLAAALQNVAADTAGRAVFGVAGSEMGAWMGLVLGPYGAVVGGLVGACCRCSPGADSRVLAESPLLVC